MLHRPVTRITVLAVAAAALLTTSPDAGAALEDPWGPPHVLYDGRTSGGIAQATTSDGTTVAVFREHPVQGEPSVAMVAIRYGNGRWGEPVRLADSGLGRGAKVIAWGAGHLSVIWTSGAGQDNVRYHMRSLAADGTLGDPEKLIKAKYASAFYRAAINSDGQVALAWSNGDQYDRVVVRELDGTWTRYPKVPVFHTGEWQLSIPEPRALFLDDAGRVSTITWGTVDDSDEAIWLARPRAAGGWMTQRVQAVDGWVDHDHAAYASNSRGDLALVSGKRESSGGWSARLRFAEAGGRLGEPTELSDYPCWQDYPTFCAGVAIADDGTATIAYAREAGGDDIVIEVVRRAPDGTFTPAQAVSSEFWENTFDGVHVTGNRQGDAVVSFTGRHGESSTGVAFARCPAASPCVETTYLDDGYPSWLDRWVTTMGDDAEVTLTWSESEWPRDKDVITRQLAAAG